MPSELPPSEHPPRPEHDLALRVKDGVRGIRQAARQGAQRLVQQMVEGEQRAPAWAPPLGQVAQLAMQAAAGLDRLAVQLISTSNEYRQMDFPLLSALDGSPRGAQLSLLMADARTFDHHYYWVLKHLLRMGAITDVSVREEAIHHAWQNFHAAWAGARPSGIDTAATDTGLPATDARALRCALLSQALLQCQPLHHGGLGTLQVDQVLVQCLVHASVLAGEIAVAYPRPVLGDEVQHALQMAWRVAQSRQVEFAWALQDKHAAVALPREFAFVLRHL